jgi:hypothetical protein
MADGGENQNLAGANRSAVEQLQRQPYLIISVTIGNSGRKAIVGPFKGIFEGRLKQNHPRPSLGPHDRGDLRKRPETGRPDG